MRPILKSTPQAYGLSFFVLVALLFLAGCGGGEDLLIDDGLTIIIEEYSFSPITMTAPAGSSVFFYNRDDMPHHILSESSHDAFDDTGLLDSLLIPVGGVAPVIIPTAATPGTEIYFYDNVLQDAMVTPNGIIVVE